MTLRSLVTAPVCDDEDPRAAIDRILVIARTYLDMDVAFVSEWTDGQQVFRHLDGTSGTFGMALDGGTPLEGSFCVRVMDGRIPNIVGDVTANLEVRDLEGARSGGIGAYIGVPVRFADGQLFGMLCCLSHGREPSLNARDVRFMEMLAGLVAERLGADRARQAQRAAIEERVRGAIDGGAFDAHLQPIVRLSDRSIVGFEALTRFRGEMARTPDVWFAEAASVGAGIDLELAAAAVALRSLRRLPGQAYLSLNFAPATVADSRLATLLSKHAARRIVVEVTEHAEVDDYSNLQHSLDSLRRRGIRLAIDDAGAGFASFRHIVQLAPDIIKADVALTRGIDTDPARQALARSLARFARDTGAMMVSEGIETPAELHTVRSLGVPFGQGYLLGRPLPAADQLAPSGESPRRVRAATTVEPRVAAEAGAGRAV